jgi:hypothetical protein
MSQRWTPSFESAGMSALRRCVDLDCRPRAEFCLSVLMSRKPDIQALAKARFADASDASQLGRLRWASRPLNEQIRFSFEEFVDASGPDL